MLFYCHDDRVEMCWIADGRSNISNNYQWNSNVYQFNRILVFPMVAGVYVYVYGCHIFLEWRISLSHSISLVFSFAVTLIPIHSLTHSITYIRPYQTEPNILKMCSNGTRQFDDNTQIVRLPFLHPFGISMAANEWWNFSCKIFKC